MKLANRYDSRTREENWQQFWEIEGVFNFSLDDSRPIYSIDTPPATVSGDLHLGHCFSYSQTDFMARFCRMNGYNVFYPMGWDDNGLPTERLVERRLGIRPVQVGREKFIEAILEVTKELEEEFERLWKRLGLSVDWRYTYSTVSSQARKISQYSFIDLYNKGIVYRASAPTIWCPFCSTAIAQAEVDDLQRETGFLTVAFRLDNDQVLPIATTRPELLPACVAVFVNPKDERYREIVGRTAITPLFEREIPVKADPKADPGKGTGVVMCCTFGDTTDVEWWRTHNLPLISVINPDGTLNEQSGPYQGLDIKSARERIIADLASQDLLIDQRSTIQTIRVHERCDTPVEYIEAKQWFVRLLDRKEDFLDAGRHIRWHPSHMHARYEDWVQNLTWDWCISRQRYYGVPFPVWYCASCGNVILADRSELPVDPLTQQPSNSCECGSTEFVPELDVMDTWATSSLSPQIATRWLENEELFSKLSPMSLRPQAHDIIRTWTFYTIVKALYHFGQRPWSNIAISGHGLAPEGRKVSKSKGGGPLDPTDAMDRYSADAVRYWAASTRLGRDSIISEEKISVGKRVVTKLWNVARFTLPFLQGYQPPRTVPDLLPSDRWVLSRLQHVIHKAGDAFTKYDHVSAKEEIDSFFWNVVADNYLEMVKGRLYELNDRDFEKEAARYTLHNVLLAVIKMFAPIMPHVTEEIFQLHFGQYEAAPSIHVSRWPEVSQELISYSAEALGDALVGIATVVRHYKSTNRRPMGVPLRYLRVSSFNQQLLADLRMCMLDLRSVTRVQSIDFSDTVASRATAVPSVEGLWATIEE